MERQKRLMPGLFALLLVALLLALPGAATAQSPAAPPAVQVTQVDTGNYPEVTVYVAAHDATGSPLAGLSQADFSLSEDGTPVTVSDFRGSGTVPLTSVLVIDRSGSMNELGKLAGARAAAQAFVDQMRPGDRTALVAFNSQVASLSPFSADQAALHAELLRVRADGGTAVYDAVAAGAELLADQSGRRALLVLTDGQDCRENNPCPAEEGSRHPLTAAIAAANQSAQPVYVIGLGDPLVQGEGGIDENVLRRIAAETGGEYFYAPQAAALADLYTRLSSDLQAEYALTYVSPRPFFDGTRRDIQVQIGTAAATSGYTERHLIDVRSHPLVALALLLPLLGLLAMPALQARRNRQPRGAQLATVATAAPAPLLEEVVAGRCHACDAELYGDANFCTACGADQRGATAVEPAPAFCTQCGNQLRPGAHFCGRCGTIASALTPETEGRP